MSHFPPDAETVRSWKRFFGGLTAALLLLPIPAFAALNSLGAWTYGANGVANPADNPFGWNNPVGSGIHGLTLDFLPKANSTALGSQTTVEFFSVVGAGSTSANATFTKWNDITMTVGKVTIQVQVYNTTTTGNADINNTPNQFAGTVTANLHGGTQVNLIVADPHVINVILTFSAGSKWTTTSSSPHTVFR